MEEAELDALLENAELEHMLQFETQIFLDIVQNDGLVIAAKGLNIDLVLLNLLKVFCDTGNLVLVMNCTAAEEQYLSERLQNKNVYTTTFATNTDEREDVYLSGGIHFVTTRILVVDMLKKRIPIDKITGIIILRAHRIFESCQEAFVLRLFRQHNKTGFVKAFSNNAQSFTVGFGHVERVMRTLFVKELYIWPRFHSIVNQSLKDHQPQVIELHIPISETIQKMQSYILELMNLTVAELKRINKTIELQEITVENCLTKNFHKILQAQLDLIWHQLSSKSMQLVAELKTLRHLILSLLYADPVTFYSVLSEYRTMEYALKSAWVLYDPAERLFDSMNSLIYSGDKCFNPELCPKWKSLFEILKIEIPERMRNGTCKDKADKILILCADNRTCHQLNEVLTQGTHEYLLMTAIQRKVSFKTVQETFNNCGTQLNPELDVIKASKKLKTEQASTSINKSKDEEEVAEEETDDFQSSYYLTMTQLSSFSTDNLDITFAPFSQLEDLNLTQICKNAMNTAKEPTLLIQTFKGSENYISLQKTLQDLKPAYVIMYHNNITAVRELEMYEAHRAKEATPLTIYFLVHAESVEEQSYLTTLRREKQAFEHLIKTKSIMVVPEDQDGKSEDCIALQRELLSPTKNTRQGGTVDENKRKQTVIVDMREFRSELPALIHKRGMEIDPVTITVGDYILTPEICVERKSLSDLVGSLNSGRLYQQCTQMSRFYSKPMLLIEFDQNKPFSWKNHYMLSNDTNNFDVQKKLLLLTLHFPKLKLIWSSSPYASAQLFEELKQGKQDPNPDYASAIGTKEDLDIIETRYNSGIYDFIQKLPGISSKNIDGFLRKTKNMLSLVKKSKEELIDLVGNPADANALFSIIHEEHSISVEPQPKQKAKFKNKFKFYQK